jgi:hypothetical protein
MGRIKSAAQKLREANFAKARETAIAARVPSTSGTVRPRKTRQFVYRSYSLKAGATQQLLSLSASDAAVDFFGQNNLGLQLPTAVTDPVIAKPDGFKPAMLNAMVGSATPTASVSPWGTRVIKYSAATTGTSQAHYSAAICILSGTATFDAVDAQATGLFNSIRTKLGNLDYARFYVMPEEFTISKN